MFLDVTGQERKEEPVEEKVKKPSYDWSFENSINTGKTKLVITEQPFKYDKWRTNSTLSNYTDTLFYANMMNMNYDITDEMHYNYLFHSVRKAKRFGRRKTEQDKEIEKQIKEEQEKIALIQEYYKYNLVKAKTALNVLTDVQLDKIKRRLEKGGTK